jgi:hypothetical protein
LGITVGILIPAPAYRLAAYPSRRGCGPLSGGKRHHLVSIPDFPLIFFLFRLRFRSRLGRDIPGNSSQVRGGLPRFRGQTLRFRRHILLWRGLSFPLGRGFRRILGFLFDGSFRRMPGLRVRRHHYPWLRLFYYPGNRGGRCLSRLLFDHDDLPAFSVFRARSRASPGGRFVLTLYVFNEFRFRFLGIF